MLGSDTNEQRRFADHLAESAPKGLLDAVIIHRHTVVGDWHLEGRDRVNFVFSCTKSFLSALVGIAIERGLVGSLDTAIEQYFPELTELNPDARWRDITIRHLLSMTSGIVWPSIDRAQSMHNRMVKSPDWVRFVLEQPLSCPPGTQFNYCDGGSHLLSAILTRTTGQSALALAETWLFPFIGVERARWKENNGINLGSTGLHVRSIDMAMLGYLYCHYGEIDGKQIVSAGWVERSTQVHSEGIPHWFGNYGLHWWVSPRKLNGHVDLFFALGAHGQYVIVSPDYELVAAFRKKPGTRREMTLPMRLFLDYVLRRYGTGTTR